MLRFQLPTDRIEYLQLVLPANPRGLVAWWGTQLTPITVAAWDDPGRPPCWEFSASTLQLSPDGEWVSLFDKQAGKVRVTRVGADAPTAVLSRDRTADNVWTAVAPGGQAVAWKDDQYTVVRSLPSGKPLARVKSGFGYDLQFSPGRRWLTEKGTRVYRVFDRENDYRVIARIPTPQAILADVADGPTAVVDGPNRGVASIWDLSQKSCVAAIRVKGIVHALAMLADGQRILTGIRNGELSLWDISGNRLKRYSWGLKMPLAVAFSREGTRAAVGGADGQILVWDLDN